MGFLASLFTARFRSGKLDSDPIQHEFADHLKAAAEGGFFQEAAIKPFVDKYGWSRSEKELRFAHALSIVKATRPDIHKDAKEVGLKWLR